jgi:hypothetical protein
MLFPMTRFFAPLSVSLSDGAGSTCATVLVKEHASDSPDALQTAEVSKLNLQLGPVVYAVP